MTPLVRAIVSVAFFIFRLKHEMALSRKQQVWLEGYLTTWNATEAARRAGYAHPRQEGARLLSNAVIAEEIQSRLAEKAMSADEALARLAEQARAEYSSYFRSNGTIDLEKLLADGKGHLIKKIKPTAYGNEIEFYDGQTALLNIGRHHKLFVDRSEVSGELEFTESESAAERILSRIDSVATRIRAQSSPVGTSSNGSGAESA